MTILGKKSTAASSKIGASASPVRVADQILDSLLAEGIDTVFGVPGGAISPFYDALLDQPRVRLVTTRHEAGAMFAAAGYAVATGRMAAVAVTSGPGALGCLPGIASARCDSLPILVLTGEVARPLHGRGALQEGSAHHLNLVGMAQHVTKLAKEITQPAAAAAQVRGAIATARSGRPGPVLLSIPIDVSNSTSRPPTLSFDESSGPVRFEARRVHDVASILRRATRPVIFAGSGTRWGRGPSKLRQLAERLQCPVMTTPKGKGVFPESHPLSLGVFGHGGHPSAQEYLEGGVDVLLAIGTSLSDPATNGWSRLLVPSDHFLQIDVDPMNIGRNYEVTHALIGPADEGLSRLLEEIPPAPVEARSFEIRHHTNGAHSISGSPGTISPQRAIWELQRKLPQDSMFSVDIGQHLLFATHYLSLERPDSFLIQTGLASMGSGLAGALGMSFGQPNRTAVALIGDGCFAMSLPDLATAVRERLPLIIAVLNDERYGMVEDGHQSLFGRTPEFPVRELSVSETARGLGAEAIRIESPLDIQSLDLALEMRQVPIVLDIRVDENVRMPKLERFEQLGDNMRRASPRKLQN